MTCAQGLLRLLWGGGGPKLECYGTVHMMPITNWTIPSSTKQIFMRDSSFNITL